MANDLSGEPGEPILRDHLALARTQLANERTLLAYVRTVIMLAATGATLLKLYGDAPLLAASAWGLMATAVVLAGLGAARFYKQARALKQMFP
jgi:putative membrane protein